MAFGIIKAIQEHKSKAEFDEQMESASQMIEEEKAAIHSISQTSGFRIMIEYFESQLQILNKRADTTNSPQEWGIARGNAKFCQDFISYFTKFNNPK